MKDMQVWAIKKACHKENTLYTNKSFLFPSFKIYVTSTALNGKVQGFDVEEGSQSQSKLLEAFSAWVMEDEDDGVAEDDFLFTHVSLKL